MKYIRILTGIYLLLVTSRPATGQTAVAYNLSELLQKNQIDTTAGTETRLLKNSKPGAISSVRPVLFKDIDFTEGSIDIDLRGQNKFLQSFLAFSFTPTTPCILIWFFSAPLISGMKTATGITGH